MSGKIILLLLLAGALGTLARYCCIRFFAESLGTAFPWGTLFVNVAGSFAAGFLLLFLRNSLHCSDVQLTIVMVGFLGAFTTFSTYALEAGAMFENAAYWKLAGHVILNNVLGLGAGFCGLALGRICS